MACSSNHRQYIHCLLSRLSHVTLASHHYIAAWRTLKPTVMDGDDITLCNRNYDSGRNIDPPLNPNTTRRQII